MDFETHKTSWLAGRYGVVLLACVVSVAFFGVWSYQILQGEGRAIRTAKATAENLVRAAEDANSRTFQAVDLILTSVIGSVQLEGRANSLKSRSVLLSLLDEAPQVREVAFADASGRIIATSRRSGLMGLSIANEDYFKQARAGTLPALYISPPQPGRLLGETQNTDIIAQHWHLIVARAVFDEDEIFKGIALAVINLGFFQEQISAYDVGLLGSVRYYRYDGELLVQGGANQIQIGHESHADEPLFTDHLPKRDWGTYHDKVGDLHNGPMIVSYRATTRWPLLVAVVLNMKEALLPWHRDARDFSFVMLGGLGVLLGLAFVIYRQRSEAEQHEKQMQLLGTALKTSANMVLITDVEANIVWVNDSFCTHFGYTKDEVIGQSPKLLKSGLVSTDTVKSLWETILNGQTWNGQLINRCKNGSLVAVKQTVTPIMNQNHEITHFVGIHVDITMQSKIEQDLIRAKNGAEKANMAKSEFLSSMSHELRTPLNAILGFAQVLELNTKEPLSEHQKDATHQIIKGGEHLLGLINDVLNLSKIDAGYMDLEIEAIDMEETIKGCISLIESSGRQLGIRFNVDNVVGAIILADEMRFKQALLNLMSNAVKYNRKNGYVSVKTSLVGDDMQRISILDTGYGIPVNKQKELFAPFSRLGAENSTIEGTGIGLTITKRLVEAMDGRVGFESTEGVGSVFWLELPLALTQKDDF